MDEMKIDWGNLHDKVNHPELTKDKVRAAIINAATRGGNLDAPIVRFMFEGNELGEMLVSIEYSTSYDYETANALGTIKAKNIFELFFEGLKQWLIQEFIKVNPAYSDPTMAPVNTFFYHYLDVYAADIIRDNFLILDNWFTFEEWADMLFNGSEYHDCRPDNSTIAYKK